MEVIRIDVVVVIVVVIMLMVEIGGLLDDLAAAAVDEQLEPVMMPAADGDHLELVLFDDIDLMPAGIVELIEDLVVGQAHLLHVHAAVAEVEIELEARRLCGCNRHSGGAEGDDDQRNAAGLEGVEQGHVGKVSLVGKSFGADSRSVGL